jgi:hypothetical protein
MKVPVCTDSLARRGLLIHRAHIRCVSLPIYDHTQSQALTSVYLSDGTHYRSSATSSEMIMSDGHDLTQKISNPPIPQELTEGIIDLLHDDIHALGTLALVSKSWLPRSRFHLFEELRISQADIDSFLVVLDSPNVTICPYVRCITFTAADVLDDSPETPWMYGAIRRLTALKAVTSIIFERLKWESGGGDDGGPAAKLKINFPGVTELQVIDVKFDSFTHFTDLICAFSNLETIAITFSEENESLFTPRNVSSFAHQHLPAGLRSLSFPRCPPNIHVLEWIISLADVQTPLIDTVVFSFTGSQQLPAIGNLLKAIGPSLHYLGLSFNYNQTTFLGSCPQKFLYSCLTSFAHFPFLAR